MLALIVVFFAGCGRDNGGSVLTGTWELQSINEYDIPTIISFNRNNFILTMGGHTGTSTGHDFPFPLSGSPDYLLSRLLNPFSVDDGDYERIVSTEFVREEQSIYTHPWSGGRYTFTARIYLASETGTYSITGDRIEFILSNGRIEVFDFRRTENTLDIGYYTFHRH